MKYDDTFFHSLQTGSLLSARQIVPIILQLTQPTSVVDVGSGNGVWLSVFREYGIEDILGIDFADISDDLLLIPREKYLKWNLESQYNSERCFDLAMCLEVAEHLPAQHAITIVNSLVGLADKILFSAAIPWQGGTDHVNEQWPEYWADLFDQAGYQVIDCVRKRIWCDRSIKYWYRQNLLLFVRRESLRSDDVLMSELKWTVPSQLSIVHPETYMAKCVAIDATSRQGASLIANIVRRARLRLRRSLPQHIHS